MRAVDAGVVEWITERILETLAREGHAPPQALSLLLRHYADTGRPDVGEALGPALALGMDEARKHPASDSRDLDVDLRAEWLLLFVEAAGLSEDVRLLEAVDELVSRIESSWPSDGRLMPAMRSLDACLTAGQLDPMTDHLPAAVDELERIIGLVYVPGDGLPSSVGHRPQEAGRLLEHATAASALLTAYRAAGRLPYSMLAEELMQFARREWWDAARGCFRPPAPDPGNRRAPFIASCQAARVLCRLAVLHGDPDYRQRAVIARQSDYVSDAELTLDSLSADYRQVGLDAAVYGLAVCEFQSLGRPGPRAI
jgi:uncharacterized protein YyaL (SSP411 family)